MTDGAAPDAVTHPAAVAGGDAPDGDRAVQDITAQVEAAERSATEQLEAVTSLEAWQRLEPQILGKKAPIVRIRRTLGTLPADQRPVVGGVIEAARRRLQTLAEQRQAALAQAAREEALADDRLDLTEVIVDEVLGPLQRGHLHLVTQTRDALEDTFTGMGFEIAEGPEAETDWYNFEALNMPPGHPARGMWDTFYLRLGRPGTVVLRTHTSPVQIRLMESAVSHGTLPIHAVMPGRCYRRETPDARHLAVFHQIEGLVVDRDVTMADMAGTIETFTTAYFGPDIHSRLRPAYFPFTEPSAEFEITCTICRGSGCRTCSGVGWIELGGCGMVDPAVFASVGIDTELWSGFAFGFGIDRCAQMRHQIADLRNLTENDARFLRQF